MSILKERSDKDLSSGLVFEATTRRSVFVSMPTPNDMRKVIHDFKH